MIAIDLSIDSKKLDIWSCISHARRVAVSAAEMQVWLASLWDPDRVNNSVPVGQLLLQVQLAEEGMKKLKLELQKAHRKTVRSSNRTGR